MKLRIYKKSLEHSYTLGVHPTRALLAAKDKIISRVLINSRFQETRQVRNIIQICEKRNIVHTVSDKSIERLSYKGNTNVIGVFEKFETRITADNSHVVLFEPTNTGNMGTIMRSMVAFGIRDLAIIRPAVDVFHPKVISSSVGSFFDVNFEYFDSIEGYTANFPGREIFAFSGGGEHKLGSVDFGERFSLVFGNESRGLPKWFKTIGTSVRIPHEKAVESLNLSLSVGIALWESGKSWDSYERVR